MVRKTTQLTIAIRDLCDPAQQSDVRRAVVEVIVADQAAVGLAAELAVFFLVDFLEDGALVPGGPFEFLDRLAQLLLRDVEDANLQHFVGLGVVDQVVQAPP